MIRTSTLLMAGLLLGSAGSAQAQDLPQSLAPLGQLPKPLDLIIPRYEVLNRPVDWSGFAVTPMVSYRTAAFRGNGGRLLKDSRGFTLGGEAMYNVQVGNFVFGPAVDVSYGFMDGRGRAFAPAGLKSDIGLMGSARARAGFAVDRTLIYGTGGFAFADLRVRDSTTGVSDRKLANGWTAGGGVEYKWGSTSTLRAEYRRIQLGRERFDALPAGNRNVGTTMNILNVNFLRTF